MIKLVHDFAVDNKQWDDMVNNARKHTVRREDRLDLAGQTSMQDKVSEMGRTMGPHLVGLSGRKEGGCSLAHVRRV